MPEFASSLVVPQLMGNARAAEKLLLGDPFTAPTRSSAASPTPCCRPAEVVRHARRVAERFNALPPGAVRETKRLLRAPAATRVTGDDRRSRASVFGERLQSAEAKEAFSAFFQKRQPDFSQVLSRRADRAPRA